MKRPKFLCVLAAVLIIFQPFADGRPYLEKLDTPYQTEGTVGADPPSSSNTAEDGLRPPEAMPAEGQFPGDASSTGSLLESMSPTGFDTTDDSPRGTIPGLTPAESVELVEQILQGNLQPVIDGPAVRSDDVPLIAKVSLLPPLQPISSTDSDLIDPPPVVLGSPEIQNPAENPINSMVSVPPALLMPSASMNTPPLKVSGMQQQSYGFLPPQDHIPSTQDDQLKPSPNVSPRSSAVALAAVPIEKPEGDFVPDDLVDPQRSPEPIEDPENQLEPDKLVNRRSTLPIEEPADQLVPESAEDIVPDEVVGPQRSTVFMDEPVEEIKDFDRNYFIVPQQSIDEPEDQLVINVQRSTVPMDEPLQYPKTDELVNPQQSTAPADERLQYLAPDDSLNPQRSTTPIDEPSQDRVPDELVNAQRSTAPILEHYQVAAPYVFVSPQRSTVPIDNPLQDDLADPQRTTVPMNEPTQDLPIDESKGSQRSSASVGEPIAGILADPHPATVPIDNPSEEPVPNLFAGPQRSLVPIDQPLEEPVPSMIADPQRSTVPIDNPLEEPVPSILADPQPSTVPIDNSLEEPVPSILADPRPLSFPTDDHLEEPLPNMVAVPQRSTVPIDKPLEDPVHSMIAVPQRSTVPIDNPLEEPVPSILADPQPSTVPIDNSLEEPVPSILADPRPLSLPTDNPLEEHLPNIVAVPQRSTVPTDKPLDDLVPDDPSDSLQPNTNPLSTNLLSKPEPNARNFPSQGGFLIPTQNIPSFLGNGFVPADINSPLAGTVPAEMPYVPEYSEYPLQGGFQEVPQTMEYIPETVNMEAQGVPFLPPENVVPPMMGMPQIPPANMQPFQGGSSLLGNSQQLNPMYENIPDNQPSFVGGNVYPTSGGAMPPGVFVPANQNSALNVPNFSAGMVGPSVPGSDVKIRPDANEMFIYQSPSYQGDSAYPEVHGRVTSTSPRSPIVTTPEGNAGPSTVDPRIHFPIDDWPSAPSPNKKAIQKQSNPPKKALRNFRNLDEDLLAISDVLDSISDSRSVEISDEVDSGEGDEFWKNMETSMDYKEGHGIVSRQLPAPVTQEGTPVLVPLEEALGRNNDVPPVFQSNLPKLDLHTMRIPTKPERFETYDVPQIPPSSPSHGLEKVQNVESRQSEVEPAEGNERVNSDKYFSTPESDNVVDEALETESPPEEFTTTERPVDEFMLTTETPGIENLDTILPEIQENEQIWDSELARQSEDGPINPTEVVTEENFREDSHPSKRSAGEEFLPGRRKLLSRDVGGSDKVRELDNRPQLPRNDIRFDGGIKEIFTTDEPLLAEDKPPLEFAINSTSLQDENKVSERTDLESVEEGAPTLNKNHSVSKKDDPMNTLEYLTENAGDGDDASNQEIVIKNLPDNFHPLKDSKPAELGKKSKKELQRVRRNSDVDDALRAALLDDSTDQDSTPVPAKPMTPSSAPVNPVLTSPPSSNIVKPAQLPLTALQATTKPLPTTRTPSTTSTTSTHVASTTSTPSTTLQSTNPSTTFEPLPTPIPDTSTTVPSLTSTPLPTNSTTPKKKKKKVWNIPFYPNNIVMSSNGEVHLEPKNKSAPLPPSTTAKPFIRRLKPEELEAARERLLKRFQSRRPPAMPNATLLPRTQPQGSVTPPTPNSTQVKRAAVPATAPPVGDDILAYMTAQNPSQLPSLLYNSPEEREEARRRRLRNMVGLAGDVRSFLSDRAKHAMYSVGRVIGGDEQPKKSQTS